MKLELSRASADIRFVGTFEGELPSVPAIANSSFKGEVGEWLPVFADRLCYIGMGPRDGISELRLRKIGGRVGMAFEKTKLATGSLDLCGDFTDAQKSALAVSAALKAYRFDKYKSEKKPEQRLFVDMQKAAFGHALAVVDAVSMARDLTNEPSNRLSTTDFVGVVRGISGVEVEIFDAAALERMGAGLILAVGRGSESPPYMAVMKYMGRGGSDFDLGLVGKGVCFDSGGLCIKPSSGMWEMKGDMAGAAVVVSIMKLLADTRAKKNVVAVAGLAENIPDGRAYRPGDILRSLCGRTVEVVDTDAEGRLVLADCLSYVSGLKPRTVIDFATLTGAMCVALADHMAGMFSNSDDLASAIERAGKLSGEEVWRLPLSKAYADHLESKVADVANLGHPDRVGGAVTAAEFLHGFVPDGISWAHIDIAGAATSDKGTDVSPKGTTGWGVELIERFLR
ncbi:MAG: leucyl aminopeptidase [Rickettsiales bacterium]|jgi:leucyl aminopeptidase|nr:leucyl aminopeptidase [Rickettsiales bacterium]